MPISYHTLAGGRVRLIGGRRRFRRPTAGGVAERLLVGVGSDCGTMGEPKFGLGAERTRNEPKRGRGSGGGGAELYKKRYRRDSRNHKQTENTLTCSDWNTIESLFNICCGIKTQKKHIGTCVNIEYGGHVQEQQQQYTKKRLVKKTLTLTC